MLNKFRFSLLLLVVIVGQPLTLSACEPEEVRFVRGITFSSLQKESEKWSIAQRDLFAEIFPVRDVITLDGKKEVFVKPVAFFLNDLPKFTGKLNVETIAADGKSESLQLFAADISQWQSFESLALAKIVAFNRENQTSNLATERFAEKLLVALSVAHRRMRHADSALSDNWQKIDQDIYRELFEVRQKIVSNYWSRAKTTGRYDAVIDLVSDLAKTYPSEISARRLLASIQIDQARKLLQSGEFRKVRELVIVTQELLPGFPETESLAKKLTKLASDLRLQAEKSTINAEKIRLLERALLIDPHCPGARDDLLRLQENFSRLIVYAKDLPKHLSPVTAASDIENLCLPLVFQSLLRHQVDSNAAVYVPELTSSLPHWQDEDLHFYLSPNVYWSNGQKIQAADIRHTIELMRDINLSGRDGKWQEVVNPPRLVGGNPGEISFRMKKTNIYEPLSLFQFQILPQKPDRKKILRTANDQKFSKSPIGSGPFVFQGHRSNNAGSEAVFSANPYFEGKYGKFLPYIRSIHMRKSENHQSFVDHSRSGTTLWLDPSLEEIKAIGQSAYSLQTITEPEVSYLAVNHRRKSLQDRTLRLVLSFALQRETILDQSFRGADPSYAQLDCLGASVSSCFDFLTNNNEGKTPHHLVNGLFPADSWANAPISRVPQKLFDGERARLLLRSIPKPKETVRLSLLCPNTDPRVIHACHILEEQWRKVAADADFPLEIDLKLVSPSELQVALQTREFDLAYTSLRHDDHMYWIWPLFDPRSSALANGGSNFLGYENDATLVSLCRARMNEPNFQKLKKITHDLHAHLFERMPVIPLWQLDRLIMHTDDLQMGYLDGNPLFQNIANWKIKTNR